MIITAQSITLAVSFLKLPDPFLDQGNDLSPFSAGVADPVCDAEQVFLTELHDLRL